MSITPIGTSMDFRGVDIDGKEFKEHIVNKDGIITDLIMKVDKPIINPIVIGADDGTHKLDIAICYDAGDPSTGPSNIENITSFSNYCPTVSGTHVDGSVEGITRWFTMYMNNIYLAGQKSNKLKVNSADIKTGLNAFIAASHLYSNFIGQSKDILSNEDMIGFCKETVMKGLDNWSKNNPQDLQKLAKFFKDICELRIKQENGKAKIVTKYQKNTMTNLPKKYMPPINKTGIELVIVEGDSALGTTEIDRDKYTQGIFPIRGKIINAFGASKSKFFSNEEVQGITQIIFGQEYKSTLTLKDCKVDKIIFMTDADVDGAHIAALLLRMFVLYFPFLIADGRVYKAIPPLYSIKEGKKHKYFTDNLEYIKYIQKLFLAQNDLKFNKKDAMKPTDVTKFFLRNSDYVYYLEKLANTYAIDPNLLEMVLNHYIINNNSIKKDKLQKEIRSAYRFMDVYTENSTIVVKGTIDRSNLIIVSDRFLRACVDIFKVMKANDQLYYYLNNKKTSIYNIMKIYESFTPPNRQRYKGLGEMNDNTLGESTLHPNGDRRLIRYTLEDAKEAIQFIREYESDSKKILSEVKYVDRDMLLD
jgi:DNA gyrase subunit B